MLFRSLEQFLDLPRIRDQALVLGAGRRDFGVDSLEQQLFHLAPADAFLVALTHRCSLGFGRERATDEGGGERFKVEFSVESYLENHARKFTGEFDANCYLYLSHASDLFDLAEYGGSVAAGFRRTRLERVLVIGVRTDILFPLHQQQELADGFKAVCPDTEFVRLDCIRGHDSFLVEMDAFRPVLCRYFET